ncbi:MAG: bis(5'-nucleosyl)-tetraphosphatase (symmetrical) YqeK [Bacilli bacterium]
MDFYALDALVAPLLTEKRYKHTLAVVETAEKLALHYAADVEKCKFAALAHDVCKCMSIKKQKELIKMNRAFHYVLDHNKEIYHGFAGDVLLTSWGITDNDILEAVRYHTSGAPNMGTISKIVYIADYIEPNRAFPGVEEARALAFTDLDDCMRYILKQTIGYLVKKEQTIFPLSVDTYNAFLTQKKQQTKG